MNQRGIAPLVIIAIVIVAVVVGVGVYVVTRGGGSGGGGLGGIPVYAGAVENAYETAEANAGLENIGVSGVGVVGAYTSTQDANTIASWYLSKMVELGWTKENEVTASGNIFLMFKRGNDGSFILIYNSQGKTDFLILYGQFEFVQQLWSIIFTPIPPGQPPQVVAGAIDGTVYDNDPTAGESYQNENVLITFCTTSGYLRDVGDPDDGLVVTIGSTRYGWGPFQATVRGQTNYGNGYVEKSGTWTDITGLSDNQGIRWKLYVPVTTAGRLSTGVNAYLYLWAREDANNVNSAKISPTTKLLWDYYDDLTITVSCRGDSFTTSWGTVRLYGFNWIA
jgi:hypothetical protein